MANCSMRSARRASLGLSYHGVGSQSVELDGATLGDARAEQAGPERILAHAARGDDAEPGDRDAPAAAVHQASLPAIRS